jgi:hypothetical protein
MQKPFLDGSLKIVARGVKEDQSAARYWCPLDTIKIPNGESGHHHSKEQETKEKEKLQIGGSHIATTAPQQSRSTRRHLICGIKPGIINWPGLSREKLFGRQDRGRHGTAVVHFGNDAIGFVNSVCVNCFHRPFMGRRNGRTFDDPASVTR